LSNCLFNRKAGFQQALAKTGSSGMMHTSLLQGFLTSQLFAACKYNAEIFEP